MALLFDDEEHLTAYLYFQMWRLSIPGLDRDNSPISKDGYVFKFLDQESYDLHLQGLMNEVEGVSHHWWNLFASAKDTVIDTTVQPAGFGFLWLKHLLNAIRLQARYVHLEPRITRSFVAVEDTDLIGENVDHDVLKVSQIRKRWIHVTYGLQSHNAWRMAEEDRNYPRQRSGLYVGIVWCSFHNNQIVTRGDGARVPAMTPAYVVACPTDRTIRICEIVHVGLRNRGKMGTRQAKQEILKKFFMDHRRKHLISKLNRLRFSSIVKEILYKPDVGTGFMRAAANFMSQVHVMRERAPYTVSCLTKEDQPRRKKQRTQGPNHEWYRMVIERDEMREHDRVVQVEPIDHTLETVWVFADEE